MPMGLSSFMTLGCQLTADASTSTPLWPLLECHKYMYITVHPYFSRLGTSVALPFVIFVGWECLSRHWVGFWCISTKFKEWRFGCSLNMKTVILVTLVLALLVPYISACKPKD